MSVTIILPFKPISINNMYYENRKHGMKSEAKDFCYQVNWELTKYGAQLKQLRSQFDETKHSLSVTMTFNYMNFYTKDRKISSKIYDLTNSEKLLLDLVVDAAHFGTAPYKSPNLCLNDKYVVELHSYKKPSTSDSIEITIAIVTL